MQTSQIAMKKQAKYNLQGSRTNLPESLKYSWWIVQESNSKPFWIVIL